MNPFSYFMIPDHIVETVYDIKLKYLDKKKIKLIIFDIDNTLVSYLSPEPDDRLVKYLRNFKRLGIEIALLSNNSEERVEKFNEKLGFFAVHDAGKPHKKSVLPILRHFPKIKKKNILLVGDQLLTDVVTAKINGFRAIKVKPIEKNENFFFRLKRKIEEPFIEEYYAVKDRRREKLLVKKPEKLERILDREDRKKEKKNRKKLRRADKKAKKLIKKNRKRRRARKVAKK